MEKIQKNFFYIPYLRNILEIFSVFALMTAYESLPFDALKTSAPMNMKKRRFLSSHRNIDVDSAMARHF